MSPKSWRAVYDCNVYFQALISPEGPAARCLISAARGQVALFCSAAVLVEFHAVCSRPALRVRFGITDDGVHRLTEVIREAAEFVESVPEIYSHPVDPGDSHYVDLALATGSALIVTRDNHL